MNHFTKPFLSVTLLLSVAAAAQTQEFRFDTSSIPTAETTSTTETIETDFNTDEMVRELLQQKDAQRRLLAGIALADTEMIESALKDGADIDQADENGNLPIHIAASFYDLDVIRYLIQKGANPEAAFVCGVSQRQLAHQTKSSEGEFKDQALHMALRNGNMRTARVLIENGADVNIPDSEGFLPIHIAAAMGADEMVNLLIKYGANINTEYKPVLDIFIIEGSEENVNQEEKTAGVQAEREQEAPAAEKADVSVVSTDQHVFTHAHASATVASETDGKEGTPVQVSFERVYQK